MLKRHNPASVNPPFSPYSHGVETPAGARWLHVSGQVGVTPEGELAGDAEAQHAQTWTNVLAIVAAAGMGTEDIVRVNAYITRAEDVPLFRAARDAALAGAEPASTLLVISALAHPDWVVEIEVVAAKV